jgi:hypothetical protein
MSEGSGAAHPWCTTPWPRSLARRCRCCRPAGAPPLARGQRCRGPRAIRVPARLNMPFRLHVTIHRPRGLLHGSPVVGSQISDSLVSGFGLWARDAPVRWAFEKGGWVKLRAANT